MLPATRTYCWLFQGNSLWCPSTATLAITSLQTCWDSHTGLYSKPYSIIHHYNIRQHGPQLHPDLMRSIPFSPLGTDGCNSSVPLGFCRPPPKAPNWISLLLLPNPSYSLLTAMSLSMVLLELLIPIPQRPLSMPLRSSTSIWDPSTDFLPQLRRW